MPPRNDLVTINGNPLTLVDDPIAVGAPLPDVPLVDTAMQPRRLGEFRGRPQLISVVGSLDTALCDAQSRNVAAELGQLSDDVALITVSIDTPMAQARWQRGAGDERMVLLSDFKDHAFGHQTGLRCVESGMLARALIVADGEGIVRYVQVSPDVDIEPVYAPAIQAARELL